MPFFSFRAFFFVFSSPFSHYVFHASRHYLSFFTFSFFLPPRLFFALFYHYFDILLFLHYYIHFAFTIDDCFIFRRFVELAILFCSFRIIDYIFHYAHCFETSFVFIVITPTSLMIDVFITFPSCAFCCHFHFARSISVAFIFIYLCDISSPFRCRTPFHCHYCPRPRRDIIFMSAIVVYERSVVDVYGDIIYIFATVIFITICLFCHVHSLSSFASAHTAVSLFSCHFLFHFIINHIRYYFPRRHAILFTYAVCFSSTRFLRHLSAMFSSRSSPFFDVLSPLPVAFATATMSPILSRYVALNRTAFFITIFFFRDILIAYHAIEEGGAIWFDEHFYENSFLLHCCLHYLLLLLCHRCHLPSSLPLFITLAIAIFVITLKISLLRASVCYGARSGFHIRHCSAMLYCSLLRHYVYYSSMLVHFTLFHYFIAITFTIHWFSLSFFTTSCRYFPSLFRDVVAAIFFRYYGYSLSMISCFSYTFHIFDYLLSSFFFHTIIICPLRQHTLRLLLSRYFFATPAVIFHCSLALPALSAGGHFSINIRHQNIYYYYGWDIFMRVMVLFWCLCLFAADDAFAFRFSLFVTSSFCLCYSVISSLYSYVIWDISYITREREKMARIIWLLSLFFFIIIISFVFIACLLSSSCQDIVSPLYYSFAVYAAMILLRSFITPMPLLLMPCFSYYDHEYIDIFHYWEREITS